MIDHESNDTKEDRDLEHEDVIDPIVEEDGSKSEVQEDKSLEASPQLSPNQNINMIKRQKILFASSLVATIVLIIVLGIIMKSESMNNFPSNPHGTIDDSKDSTLPNTSPNPIHGHHQSRMIPRITPSLLAALQQIAREEELDGISDDDQVPGNPDPAQRAMTLNARSDRMLAPVFADVIARADIVQMVAMQKISVGEWIEVQINEPMEEVTVACAGWEFRYGNRRFALQEAEQFWNLYDGAINGDAPIECLVSEICSIGGNIEFKMYINKSNE